jgi:hypothetical protein
MSTASGTPTLTACRSAGVQLSDSLSMISNAAGRLYAFTSSMAGITMYHGVVAGGIDGLQLIPYSAKPR